MKAQLLIIIFAACATATNKAFHFIDNFDHPPDFNPVLPSANPVGATAGGALFYNTFAYADFSLSAITLTPNTPPYFAGAGLASNVLSGAPSFRPLNASVKSFTPRSIYYACQVADVVGKPAVAKPCKLQITGYKAEADAVVTQQFDYDPSVLPPLFNTFTKGTFGSQFEKVKNLSFAVLPALEAAVTVIDIDTHDYIAYFK